ncbi:MAG TPA: amidohydrolase family protein [Woeseiaceae bacterium]|nr:amidohydrolase family protein [Woeseiaceae bacterium]
MPAARIRVTVPELLAALVCAGMPGLAAPASGVTVFVHVNLIDGVSPDPRFDATVLVRDGRIESIVTGTADIPDGAQVVDLANRWMLPGLIDAHVHLSDLDSARNALRAGVTTVRSLGSNHFVDVGIRELRGSGAADLPDVVAAGYHVRHHMSEQFFIDTPQLWTTMNGLSGEADVRNAVRALAARNVDVIKVMATERAGVSDADPLKRVLSDAELAAAADEARSAGLAVAAHAHTDEAARAAVLAGVRSIEHGTLLSEETLALMRDRGTCLVPTLSFWQDMLDAGGDYDDPVLKARAEALLPRVSQATALAWRMGVAVAAGSDMTYRPGGSRRVADEVAGLVSTGLPPMEAIKAATSVAAKCLDIGTGTGAVRPELEADLVVVASDPLRDIGALRDVLLVVNDGVVVIDRLTVP